MSKVVDHSSRDHALLSPSAASRWINCPPSALMCDKQPQKPSGDAANEGTLAHEMCEYALSEYLKGNYDPLIQDEPPTIGKHTSHELFDIEMLGYVSDYCSYIIDLHIAQKGSKLTLEQKLNLSEYVPESFGSCDACIVSPDMITIVDLKYGKGVPVDALNNPQLALYALGAYLSLSPTRKTKIKCINMHIAQVRLHKYTDWSLSTEELLAFAENVVRPAAMLAIRGEGKCASGDWCRFCSAKAVCRLKSEEIASDFEEHSDPRLLNDSDIVALIPRMDEYANWIKSFNEYTLSEAMKGRKFEGYKLVAGRGVRRWTDEESAAKVLTLMDYKEEDYINKKFKGIGDIEKLVGKKNFPIYFGKEVTVVNGPPCLVPESDKREEINYINDFEKLD